MRSCSVDERVNDVNENNDDDDDVNCVLIEDVYVLSGSADKTIRKWDMATCSCVAVFEGHESTVNRIICTGEYIFSSSYDRTARCWDFESGECVREFRGHRRSVYPLIFIPSPDDDNDADNDENSDNQDILVTGSADFTAIAWSFETAEPLQTFKEHTGAITCMAIDRTGKILLTGATDSTVRSWDLKSGENLKVFEGHRSSVVAMTVSGLVCACTVFRSLQSSSSSSSSTNFIATQVLQKLQGCNVLYHFLGIYVDVVKKLDKATDCRETRHVCRMDTDFPRLVFIVEFKKVEGNNERCG